MVWLCPYIRDHGRKKDSFSQLKKLSWQKLGGYKDPSLSSCSEVSKAKTTLLSLPRSGNTIATVQDLLPLDILQTYTLAQISLDSKKSSDDEKNITR